MPENDVETKIEKDPSRKKFWRLRNLFLLVLTAFLPVVGKAGWDEVAEHLSDRQALQAKVEVLEGQLQIMDERLNDRALWESISALKNDHLKSEVQLGILQKLFDREFARAEPIAQRTAEDPVAKPPNPLIPPRTTPKGTYEDVLEELRKKYGSDFVKTDEYRKFLEQKFPNQAPQVPKK